MQSLVTTKEYLCEKCHELLKESHSSTLAEDGDSLIRHYELPADLQASADGGCRGCQILWTHIIYRTEYYGKSESEIKKIDPILLSMVESGDVHVTFWMSWQAHDGLEFGHSASITRISEQRPYREIPPILRLTKEKINDEVTALLQNTTRDWMINCSQNHEKCQLAQHFKEKSNAIPTRLIDVQSDNGDTVRLVDTKEELGGTMQPVYLILSYCWGAGNEAAKTTQNNYRQRKHQIVVRNLPKTIRDAIAVTRIMGIRYLWVDALCIIQPADDDFLDDWNIEAAQMGSYYSNALLCISALSTSDSSDGFLRERHSARYPWREGEYLQHGENFFSIKPPEEITPEPNIKFMPLMKRAWALQERILSIRRLHWSMAGLLWECDSGMFQENQPLQNVHHQLDETYIRAPVDNSIRQIFNLPKAEALGEAWVHVLEQYSYMRLTNQTDRLVAIHGVARRLSLQHDAKYFGGIFSEYCSTALIWACRYVNGGKYMGEDFPSWSWASVEIFYFRTEDLSRQNSLRVKHFARCTNSEQFPSPDEVTDFKDHSKRKLCLEAPLVSLGIGESELYLSDDSMLDSESIRSYWNELDCKIEGPVWQGQIIYMVMDRPKEPPPKTVTLLICAGEYPVEKAITAPGTEVRYKGLLVKRSEREDHEAFVRVGYFEVTLPWSQEEEDANYIRNWKTDVSLF